jgi:tetratricopeptide (TPR) repeat protein
MKVLVWLVSGLLAIPAVSSAAEKKGKDKGGAVPAAPVVRLSPGEEAVQKAQERIAAGQMDQAKRILDGATQTEGMTGEPFLLLAQMIEPSSEWERAIATYKLASEKLSGAPKGEALGRMSVVQDINGIPEAAANADAALAADPEGAWPLIAVARQRVRQKRADDALALAQKALAAGGGAAAQTAIGLAQESRGDRTAAETAYRAALGADAGSLGANLGLARVLRLTNRVAEAAPILKAIQDKAPWLSDAYGESVRVKMALGQYVEALEDATTATYLPSVDAAAEAAAKQLVVEVKIARALDDVRQGRANLAIDDLKQLRDEQPKSVEVRIGLARAYFEHRDIELAIAELNKTIEIAPNSAEAYYQLGLIQHEAKNNPVAALPAYEKAVTLDPLSVQYRVRFGNLLAAQGQSARAVAELTKVVEGPGANDAEAWTYLGGAYLAAARYDDVVTAITKSLSLIPENDTTRAHRGLACAYMTWAYLNKKDKENVLKYGHMARELGYTEATLMQRVDDIAAGKPFAGQAQPPSARPKPRPRPRR